MVIHDFAIEGSWDREKFDGFDQPLHDRVSAFYANSNEVFQQQHWGFSWQSLFPVQPTEQLRYSGSKTDEERSEMRSLMVRVLRELQFPWRLRLHFFWLYAAAV